MSQIKTWLERAAVKTKVRAETRALVSSFQRTGAEVERREFLRRVPVHVGTATRWIAYLALILHANKSRTRYETI